jgi:hypothetical protein
MSIILLVLKYISDFFSTKIGQIILIIILLICSIMYSHHLGYNKGVIFQQNIDNIALDKELKQQALKQGLIQQKAIEVVKAEKQIETVYKDRVVIVNKLIHDNPQLNSKDCSINNTDLKTLNDSLDAIK